MSDPHWEGAKCRPDNRWTSETRPRWSAMLEMSKICSSCPLEAQCAQFALDTKAEGAVMAGVYIPLKGSSGPSLRWLQAGDQLARKVEGVA